MIIISSPRKIKTEHLYQIIDLIVKGRQINRLGLKKRILRADLIAYKLKDKKVICTATLKNPSISYIKKVFNLAHAKANKAYKKELGYIVTQSDFEGKGHCKDLLNCFFKKISSNSIYATTRKNSMIHILNYFGFSQIGEIYNQDLKIFIYN